MVWGDCWVGFFGDAVVHPRCIIRRRGDHKELAGAGYAERGYIPGSRIRYV